MPHTTNTHEHHPSRITPSSPWRVNSVYVLEDYRLYVKFVDGTEGFVDLSALVKNSAVGVFAKFRNDEFFQSVGLHYGAVTWPDGLDLAPDAMHDAIQAHGTWTVGESC